MSTSTATRSIPPNLQILLWLTWLEARPKSCPPCCPLSIAERSCKEIDDITEDELDQWCGG